MADSTFLTENTIGVPKLIYTETRTITDAGYTINLDVSDYDILMIQNSKNGEMQWWSLEKSDCFVYCYIRDGQAIYYHHARKYTLSSDKKTISCTQGGYTYRDGGWGTSNIHIDKIWGIKV